MNFEQILPYVSGPVVGAVIGYFTNYIAVKMLFRPYTEKHIGPLRIPFTPGIMPKRRGALAKAVGEAVSGTLLTADDLSGMLLSEETGDRLVDAAFKGLGIAQADAPTIEQLLLHITDEEGLNGSLDKIAAFLTEKLISAAKDMQIGTLISEKGGEVFREKKASLGMLAFVISDNMIDGLMEEMGGKVDGFIEESGYATALPFVRKQLDKFKEKTADELLEGSDPEKLRTIVLGVYRRAIGAFVEKVLSGFDIAGIVESKINAMEMRELEDLCMSVMKKELNAIVNLGAIIGFFIGIINAFI